MNKLDAILGLPPIPKGIQSWGPLTILQYYLQMWPPCDARLNEPYMTDHQVFQSDTKEIMALAEGMELSVISKDHKQKSMDVGVFFVANQAELEAARNVAALKQSAWERNGSPEDVFDPVSGDLYETRPMTGVSVPKPHMVLYVRLRFSLEESPSGYVLSFAAWDLQDNVLYHNVLTHRNPGYLMRRAMHELFGNHMVVGNEGPFLEGITHLIKGRKTDLCRDTKKPSWLNSNSLYKKDSPTNNTNVFLLEALAAVLTYIAPLILLALGVVLNTGYALSSMDKGTEYPLYLTKMGAALLGIVICFWIARIIKRQTTVLTLKSKLM